VQAKRNSGEKDTSLPLWNSVGVQPAIGVVEMRLENSNFLFTAYYYDCELLVESEL